jgi:hypothetical protein
MKAEKYIGIGLMTVGAIGLAIAIPYAIKKAKSSSQIVADSEVKNPPPRIVQFTGGTLAERNRKAQKACEDAGGNWGGGVVGCQKKSNSSYI